jgi:hypothetical protein
MPTDNYPQLGGVSRRLSAGLAAGKEPRSPLVWAIKIPERVDVAHASEKHPVESGL